MVFVLIKCVLKLEGYVLVVFIKIIIMFLSVKFVFLMFWCKMIIILRYLFFMLINRG